jgi:hypothetical protein
MKTAAATSHSNDTATHAANIEATASVIMPHDTPKNTVQINRSHPERP